MAPLVPRRLPACRMTEWNELVQFVSRIKKSEVALFQASQDSLQLQQMEKRFDETSTNLVLHFLLQQLDGVIPRLCAEPVDSSQPRGSRDPSFLNGETGRAWFHWRMSFFSNDARRKYHLCAALLHITNALKFSEIGPCSAQSSPSIS